ncbi:MAG: EAL domain-containing protein [Thiotrichales bacterium]|jgi:diguanylate cyclase (GGDEF)-like protein/PAS domain S-box-containing protein|nr:EAL domain-containing protein [Thiotrichales bacterium]
MSTSEIRIKQIIQSLPDAIVVGDIDGRVKYLNPAAVTLLNYTQQTALDLPLSDIVTLVDETTDEVIACIGLKAMISGQEENAGSNALLIGKDGLSELPVEVTATPLINDDKVNGVLLTIHDVRLARFSRKQLSWNASHDTLTGLYNRFEFERQCNALLLTAKRDQQEHALLLIDIDHFRQLNELAGNHYGDELLVHIAQLLKGLLRATDHLSRNASDQFLVLLAHCKVDTAQKIAENIRQQIENTVLDIGSGQWPVTASIGIVVISAQSPSNVIQLLHEAESACFAAKQAGRNSVSCFNAEQIRQYNSELIAIQSAINNSDFALYYQVIEPTKSQSPICEILLRRVDTDGNIYEPASFLPLCERSGLIMQLDLWVIRNTLEHLTSHAEMLSHFERIHINLSAYSFTSHQFLEEVEALIANFMLPHGLLCFEISESSLMHNLAHTEQVMRVLSALGCRFAVDDVNADLNNIKQLMKLPIDMVKIDGALVQEAETPFGATIIQAIQQIAHSTNMLTVAQQVESFTIYEWLQQQQVDFVQGFILNEPKPLTELALAT